MIGTARAGKLLCEKKNSEEYLCTCDTDRRAKDKKYTEYISHIICNTQLCVYDAVFHVAAFHVVG